MTEGPSAAPTDIGCSERFWPRDESFEDNTTLPLLDVTMEEVWTI